MKNFRLYGGCARTRRALQVGVLCLGLLGPTSAWALTADRQVLYACRSHSMALTYALSFPLITLPWGGFLFGGVFIPFMPPPPAGMGNEIWTTKIPKKLAESLPYSLFCEQETIEADWTNLENAATKIGPALLQGQKTRVRQRLLARTARQNNRAGTASLAPESADEAYRTTRTGAIVASAATTAGAINANAYAANLSMPISAVSMSSASQITAKNLDVLSIFGGGDLASGGSVTPTNGQTFIGVATNPLPLPPVSGYAMALGNGGRQGALAARNQDVTDQALAQHAMDSVLALHTGGGDPTTQSVWVTGVESVVGINPTIVPSSNQTQASVMSIVGTEVTAKFASPAYIASLLAGSRTLILREMAVTQSLDLEIRYLTLIARMDKESVLGAILARTISRPSAPL